MGLLILGIFLCVKFFLKGKSLELKRSTKNFILKFNPHTALFKHELYKILVTNKGIIQGTQPCKFFLSRPLKSRLFPGLVFIPGILHQF